MPQLGVNQLTTSGTHAWAPNCDKQILWEPAQIHSERSVYPPS